MQVKIAVRHGHLSDRHQDEIREKALKLLNLFERLTQIEVTVDLQKSEADGVTKAEFVVQAEHKHDFVGSDSHAELMTAVDLAMHKVQAQLRKYKERIQDHHRGRPAAADGDTATRP